MKLKAYGFTIVELLIVIVVIGILAAISIVAYNTISQRARFADISSSLANINKAITAYHSMHGSYPVSTGWRHSCNVGSTGDAFLPGISSVVSSLPQAPCKGPLLSDDTWVYSSNGVGYKLLYLRPANASDIRDYVSENMKDNGTGRWIAGSSFGYWTSDYVDI